MTNCSEVGLARFQGMKKKDTGKREVERDVQKCGGEDEGAVRGVGADCGCDCDCGCPLLLKLVIAWRVRDWGRKEMKAENQ